MSLADQIGGTRLTLDLVHPNCWAIQATEQTSGGILAHAIYNSPQVEAGPSSVNGLFTAYGASEDEVDRLLETVSESDNAGDLQELQERFGRQRNTPGKVSREFFLEYDPNDMVCPVLLKHGFIHSAPVRIESGSEEWQVCFADDRSDVEAALDGVREEANAAVDITAITSSDVGNRSERDQRLDLLTSSQRQVFEHACQMGYYEWPRKTSTREMAAELDISKTTLLEHLRKAEAKLLNPKASGDSDLR